MTKDKGILIKNIYYMLSYAFQALSIKDYTEVDFEEFEEVHELFAVILSKGIARQIKQGLHREYISHNDTLSVMRGKLDINGTIRHKMQKKCQLACEYDELTENNIYNQILKCTLNCLIKADDIKAETRKKLRILMPYFSNVELISSDRINWNMLTYQRNNKSYEFLLNICYLILKGMIQTTEDGIYKMMNLSDDHMERLYERFILEYYRRHHPELNANAKVIDWNLTETPQDNMIKFLPNMNTDITLKKGDKTLIIDAKYYGRAMLSHYDKEKLRNGHLYQIFAYVKNEDKLNTGDVSGMLLYAKTSEETVPDFEFVMGGNRIMAKVLDLNGEFSDIAEQLDVIADSF